MAQRCLFGLWFGHVSLLLLAPLLNCCSSFVFGPELKIKGFGFSVLPHDDDIESTSRTVAGTHSVTGPLAISTCSRLTFLSERRKNHRNSEEDDEGDDAKAADGRQRTFSDIPQLPAIGESSLSLDPPASASAGSSSSTDTISGTFVGSRKFQLQYTCNICETRNVHLVSRLAYRQGVVICTCKGCGSQHLIADHLGFTNYEGGFQGDEINTIEDWFQKKDNSTTSVHRVSSDVFGLEQMLFRDTRSGSIVGEDGQLALE